MGKSPVKVVLRIRPTAVPYSGLKVNGSSLSVDMPKRDIAGPNNSLENLQFQLDGITENATQESIFSEIAQDLVDNTLSGYNSTILCYGQTGSGKTYTMSGQQSNYQQRGIVPRTLAHIFHDIDTRVDRHVTVRVSYLEIYNEQLYDLLSDNPATADNLHCMEDDGNLVIKGLSKKLVRSEEDALALFFLGEQARSTAEHALNSNSSRSHVVFTVHMDIRASTDAKERAVLSKINLVDLAGSERAKKSGTSGQAMLEAQFINKSLSFLEMTVNALARKEAHVPFRQCKLTSVLKDALGGNSKTAMIANIWPEQRHLDETISTLRFAVRVRSLVTNNRQNESSDPALLLKRYERQVQELKQELAMRDMLSGRARVQYNDLSEAETHDLLMLAREFLEGQKTVEQLPMDTVKCIKETFVQCRNVYQALKAQAPISAAAAGADGRPAAPGASQAGEDRGQVGETETTSGFNIGKAPSGARPQLSASDPTHDRSSPAGSDVPSRGHASDQQLDRPAAFARYKHSVEEGRAANEELKRAMALHHAKKAELKERGDVANAIKHEIDRLQALINERRSGAPLEQQGTIVDVEEYELLAELKEKKIKYRQTFDELKFERTELNALATSVAHARQVLLEGFEAWAAAEGAASLPGADDLDPQEEYEQIERQRIMDVDPGMTSYVAAKKRSKGADARLRDFPGDKAKGMHARKVEQAYRMNFGVAEA